MRFNEFKDLTENSYKGDGSPGMVMGIASDARGGTYEDTDLTEYELDNENGLGAVPNNSGDNPDYFGIRVMMTPSIFHRLAASLGDYRAGDFEGLVKKVADGVPIASPFLKITIPDRWEGDPPIFHDPARVDGHEGRHRMHAVHEVDGDVPVEVHIWGRFQSSEMRRRHLTDEMIEEILNGLINEAGNEYVHNIGTLKR